jgi:hypothetical protein
MDDRQHWRLSWFCAQSMLTNKAVRTHVYIAENGPKPLKTTNTCMMQAREVRRDQTSFVSELWKLFSCRTSLGYASWQYDFHTNVVYACTTASTSVSLRCEPGLFTTSGFQRLVTAGGQVSDAQQVFTWLPPANEVYTRSLILLDRCPMIEHCAIRFVDVWSRTLD